MKIRDATGCAIGEVDSVREDEVGLRIGGRITDPAARQAITLEARPEVAARMLELVLGSHRRPPFWRHPIRWLRSRPYRHVLVGKRDA